jgi:hypothetical protein
MLSKIADFLTSGADPGTWLFYAEWGNPFSTQLLTQRKAIEREYLAARTGAGRVEAACKAIDLFIKEHDLK